MTSTRALLPVALLTLALAPPALAQPPEIAGRWVITKAAIAPWSDPQQAGGPTGSHVFRTWKTSGWSTYTLTEAQKRTATVSICVKCRNYRGQWKRHGRQALVYAYWGDRPASPRSPPPRYRRARAVLRPPPRRTRWVPGTRRSPAGRALPPGR